MPAAKKTAQSPRNAARKRPVQERSRSTVGAIVEATARVLVREGYAALTTTKVALEAGVGVGTLYQYFPAKEALVLALLEANLERIEGAVRRAVEEAGPDGSLEDHAVALVESLLAEKARRPELSAALRRQLPQVQGEQVLRSAMRKMRGHVRALLQRHASELPDADLELVATVLTTSVDGAVSAAVDLSPQLLKNRAFVEAMHALVRGYLRESGWRARRSRRVA